MKLKMLLLKVVLLVSYSNTKIIFRMIKLIFGLKIDFKNWKYPIFDYPQSSCLTRYQKILWGSSVWFKNMLNFNCRLPHYEIPQLSSRYLSWFLFQYLGSWNILAKTAIFNISHRHCKIQNRRGLPKWAICNGTSRKIGQGFLWSLSFFSYRTIYIYL